MPSHLRIHLKNSPPYNGLITNPKTQVQANAYLKNLVEGTERTNLSQALTQAFDGAGKSNGTLMHNGHQTFHASAGKLGVSSVTLFYYMQGDVINLFAMGKHSGASTYDLCFFRPSTGTFSQKSIALL
ncbi:hypothetical protein ACFSGX_12455 [Sphingomonas arantia]|uniref:Uncharacterized protein n=2 Tax=Sphingomonas arantia TaxID=1460676 RepID=A0ABW4U174_9SPHN